MTYNASVTGALWKTKLDKEEKKILASVERGERKSVQNLKEEMEIAKKIATNTLRHASGY